MHKIIVMWYILVYTNEKGCVMMDKKNTNSFDKGDLCMTTTIHKWGNSLGVRIPQSIAKKYGVNNGSQVQLRDDGQRIIIEPIKDEPTLEELLSQCTPDKRHNEIDFGRVGKELL